MFTEGNKVGAALWLDQGECTPEEIKIPTLFLL